MDWIPVLGAACVLWTLREGLALVRSMPRRRAVAWDRDGREIPVYEMHPAREAR